jgi:hypothetical protein
MVFNFKKNKYKIIYILCIILILFVFCASFYYKTNNTIDTNENFVTLTATTASYAAGVAGGETWTVPAGITQATFTVVGGKGGNGLASIGSKADGGAGSNVTTTLYNLKSGDIYNIYVGNNGTLPNGGFSSDPGKLFSGGSSDLTNGSLNYTGGGGAASFITNNINTIIIVAGGGGGGGINANGGNGCAKSDGAGGDAIPRSDCNPNTASIIYCAIGSGGSTTSTTYTSNIGAVGNSKFCGGGGGGYYGGNSIGTYTGGGAGGSYVISTNSINTKFLTAPVTLAPSIKIDWSDQTPIYLPTTTLYVPTTTPYVPTTTPYILKSPTPNDSRTFATGISGGETWTVPFGVTEAIFTVIGGSGGNGYANGSSILNSPGGYGANVKTALYNLKSGDVYNIYVGGNGMPYSQKKGGVSSEGAITSTTSLYRGGDGNGGGGSNNMPFYGGGGGGAASYITDSTNTTIIVAGGGGGGGQYFGSCNVNYPGTHGGGNACIGGTSNGGAGGDYCCNVVNMSFCGGFGGSNSSITYREKNGANGVLNNGGGGGGFYGGGGGSGDGHSGGGAGGSYVISNNSINTVFATATSRTPSIKVEWFQPIATTQPITTRPITTTYTPTTTRYILKSPTPNELRTFNAGVYGQWIVPYGVIEATFTVIGGKGGDGYSTSAPATGGVGSNVTTILYNLNTGDIYNIYVGNNGNNIQSGSFGGSGGKSSEPGSPSPNLFGGGNSSSFGGGGGAASYVANTSNTAIIVAGGGGGGGNNSKGGIGGIGSNGSGGDGFTRYCSDPNTSDIKYCATDSGGSISSTTYTSKIGATSSSLNGSGGGGGGYYGGNAIGIYTGGGAGGSYVISTNSINTAFTADTSGSPSIKIEWFQPIITTQPITTRPISNTYVPTSNQFQPTTTYNSSNQPITTRPLTNQFQPTTTRPLTNQFQPTTTYNSSNQQSTTYNSSNQQSTTYNSSNQQSTTYNSSNDPTTTFRSNLYISPMNDSDNNSKSIISSKFYPIVKIS